MALYIVQHGKSLPKDADPEQGLTEEGREEVERIAGVAKSYGVKVSEIFHSGKKRARQTAEILADALIPDRGISEHSGMNPLDDAIAFSKMLLPPSNIMLVGHLPFLEKLVSYLVTGVVDRPVFRLQNGGILCMEQVEEGTWVITWALMPHIGQ